MKLQYQELLLGHAATLFQSRISGLVLEPLQSVYNLSLLGAQDWTWHSSHGLTSTEGTGRTNSPELLLMHS